MLIVLGCYEAKYRELISYLQPRIPVSLFYSNLSLVASKPRIGAFEISVRRYLSNKSQLVYSKLSKTRFPIESELLAQISALIIPEVIYFDGGSCVLELCVFDSYLKQPVHDAVVKIYKLSMCISSSNLDELKSQLVSVSSSSNDININTNNANNNTNTKANTNADTDESLLQYAKFHRHDVENNNNAHHKIKREKTEYEKFHRYKRVDPNTTIAVINSIDVEDSKLRQSVAFSRVCTWGLSQVKRWLLEYGATIETVNLAITEGVVDGTSLLKLVTEHNLHRWGVHNRILIKKIFNGIEGLKQGVITVNDGNGNGNGNEQQHDQTNTIFANTTSTSKTSIEIQATPSLDNNKNNNNPIKYVNYHAVWEGSTKTNHHHHQHHSLLAPLPSSGSYLLEIISDKHIKYTSHIIHVNKPEHFLYCSSLKPKLAKVTFEIQLEPDDSHRSLVSFAGQFLIVSLVNIKTGIRHAATGEYIQENKSPKSAQTTADNDNENDEDDKLSLINRSYSMMGAKSVLGLVSSDKKNIKSDASNFAKYSRAVGTIFVPLGVYYSEVDGEIVSFDEDESGGKEYTINYSEKLSLKCHARIIKQSINLFQKLYRKYKKNYLSGNFGVMIFIRKRFAVLISEARDRIIYKRTRKIQSIIRMHQARVRYQVMYNGFKALQLCYRAAQLAKLVGQVRIENIIAKFQAMYRGKKVKIYFQHYKKMAKKVIKYSINYVRIIKLKKMKSATVIQTRIRIYLSKKILAHLKVRHDACLKLKPVHKKTTNTTF